MRGQIEESCRWRQVDLYALRHRDVRIRQGQERLPLPVLVIDHPVQLPETAVRKKAVT